MESVSDILTAALADGPAAGIDRLAQISDPREAAEAAHAAMRGAYWDHKDVPLVAALAYAGIGRALADAAHRVNRAVDLRSAAKAMAYDLASFCWPGWDEPGLAIGPSEASAGLAAARINLTWARSLDKGPLAESRAQWMLGAHLLAAGRASDAADSFRAAAALAERAAAGAEASLAVAFVQLARSRSGEPGADADLAAALAALREEDDGEAFAAQVEAAQRVFC